MTKKYLQKLPPRNPRRASEAPSPLTTFFVALEERDWVEFLDDLIECRPTAYEILGPGKGEDLVTTASVRLRRLGQATQRRAGMAIQELLITRLLSLSPKRKYALRSQLDLLHLACILTEGVHSSTLLQVVLSDNLSAEIRVAAAKALANRAEVLSSEIWQRIEAEALPGLPELVQPMLSGWGARYPAEALLLLTRIEISVARPELLESPLRLILRKTLAADEGWVQVARVLRSAPGWVREVLKRVLHFREFSQSSVLVARLAPFFPLSEPEQPQRLDSENAQAPPQFTPSGGYSPFLHDANRRWIDDAVANSLDRYRNAGTSDTDHLEALLALVGENPSIPVFSALVGLLESLLLDAVLGKTRLSEGDIDQVMSQIIESFGKMPAVIHKLVASNQEPESSTWLTFRRCLQMALGRAGIAELALDQLVTYVREQSEASNAIRLALSQDHLSADRCRDILLLHWPPITCDSILAGVIDLGAELQRSSIDLDSEAFRVAAKLRSLDVSYIQTSEENDALAYARALLDDRAVPPTYRQWSASFAPSNWRSLL